MKMITEKRKSAAGRLACAAIALCMAAGILSAGTITALAADEQQLTTTQKEGTTKLSTSKDASYIVVIPKQASIAFDDTSTSIGNLVYQEGNLEPDAYVTVTLSNKTALAHKVKDSYTIPYRICGADKNDFTSVVYNEQTKAGTQTPLTAEITQTDWEAAKAGDYEATLTFQISYTNPHETQTGD